MSIWEEATGQTQVRVGRLYVCTGLGTPWKPQSELVDVARESKVWSPLLKLLPPRPNPG